MVLRRDILPGRHVGRFQRDANVILPGKEQRHLGNRFPDREVCHKGMYDRWKNTRMANVVVDPKQHPEAILGDFIQSRRDQVTVTTKFGIRPSQALVLPALVTYGRPPAQC